MANPNFQFPSLSNHSSRQEEHMDLDLNNLCFGDISGVQGTANRNDPSQGYGPNEHTSQAFDASWATNQFSIQTTPVQSVMHSRSTSEHLQRTSMGLPEHYGSDNRRHSVPSNHYTFQHISQPQLTLGCNTESQTLQAHPSILGNQYQQYLTQPIAPLLAPRPLVPLMIPPSVGGPIPSPHSASPPRTPWYTPQSSPHPRRQISPGFLSNTPFYFNQGSLIVPDTGYGGSSRSAVDRTTRSNLRDHPYQYHGARRVSPTWGNVGQMEGAGSSADFPPIASSSQIILEGSDSATSPGADSDPYRSFPNTPADTSGAMSEELDEAALKEQQRKEKQRLKKKEDRKRESTRLGRLKKLLGLGSVTMVDILEKVIQFLGGNVPDRKNEPTAARQGRNRSGRAEQVSATRNDVTRLFDVIGECMGYAGKTPPKRELLLEEVAREIEQRIMTGMQPPGPQEGEGSGGHH